MRKQSHQEVKRYFQDFDFTKLKRVFPQLEANIDLLCKIQNHSYKDMNLAAIALTHRSALVFWPSNKKGVYSNERLEFLGDAFLNYFIAFETLRLRPTLHEGELSKLRAAIVGTENLANKCRAIGLCDCLLTGKSELSSPDQKRNNIFADAFEAAIAALVIDAGEEKAENWLRDVFKSDFFMEQNNSLMLDAKGRVQQWVQNIINEPPYYRTIGTEGTPQETFFIVAAFIYDQEIARATARSKKEASKIVAENLLNQIQTNQLTTEFILEIKGKKHDRK